MQARHQREARGVADLVRVAGQGPMPPDRAKFRSAETLCFWKSRTAPSSMQVYPATRASASASGMRAAAADDDELAFVVELLRGGRRLQRASVRHRGFGRLLEDGGVLGRGHLPAERVFLRAVGANAEDPARGERFGPLDDAERVARTRLGQRPPRLLQGAGLEQRRRLRRRRARLRRQVHALPTVNRAEALSALVGGVRRPHRWSRLPGRAPPAPGKRSAITGARCCTRCGGSSAPPRLNARLAGSGTGLGCTRGR